MKKILSLIITGLLCFSILSTLAPKVKAQETILFQDDFESYAVGTFPSTGGWQLWFSGAGQNYVTDTVSVSGTKSYHSRGSMGWAAWIARPFTSVSRFLGYEVCMRAEDVGGSYYSVCAGFLQKTGPGTANLFASIWFKQDGTIRGPGDEILFEWAADTWYKVRVILDRDTHVYSLWIDDILISDSLTTGMGYDLYQVIEVFGLGAEWSGVAAYHDDVKVFEGTPPGPPILQATVNINPNTLNLKSKGKWITAYIELPEDHDVNDIDVSTILLNGSIPAEMHPTSIGDYDNDDIPDLMVKFDRPEVISLILANVNVTKLHEERFLVITLTVTGYLCDGSPFHGSDTVRIIMSGGGMARFNLRR